MNRLLHHAFSQVGLAQLPEDPFMVILYSSFLIDVQSSSQSGYAALKSARKLDAGFLMRCVCVWGRFTSVWTPRRGKSSTYTNASEPPHAPGCRFAMFSREQQRAQRMAAGGMAQDSADLVSYVEFQRNYG